MKNVIKILMICVILFSITDTKAQGRGISYQGTLRDIDGNLMVNEDVIVIFDIREISETGASVYNETHSITTNEYGGFNAIINEGTVNSGNYYIVDWGNHHHFLNVNVNGNDLGTSRFENAPFALHSSSADRLTDPLWERESPNEIATTNQVMIGSTTTNNGELLYIYDADLGLNDELVDFHVEDLTTNRDVLNLQVGNASSEFGQFIECRKGTELRFKVDVNGSVIANEVNTTNTGNANLVPIAYGHVSSTGVLSTTGSTGNISITKTSTGLYIITVAGETLSMTGNNIQITSEASLIGPIVTNYAIVNTGINAGKLQVYSYLSTTGSLRDNSFSFTIYKP